MHPTVARTILICSRTPAVFRALVCGLEPDWTEHDYGPMPLTTPEAKANPDSVGGARTWSVREIMAHMLFNERTDWMPRIRWVFEHGEAKPFERFDMIGHKPLLAQHTLAEMLDLFERERAASLGDLAAMSLSEADLARRGTHPALGPATVAHLLGAWIVHDLNHIAQMCKAMAYQAKSDAGPWEAYMSILSPPSPRGGKPNSQPS
ncbi:MAG: DinB family protein [Phycisphaerales bacterium]